MVCLQERFASRISSSRLIPPIFQSEPWFAQGRITLDDRLSSSQLRSDTCNRSGSVLSKNDLEQNTPLFYYILKEAELKGDGITLGPVGSHIVSEVVQSALEADPDGYLAVIGPKWE